MSPQFLREMTIRKLKLLGIALIGIATASPSAVATVINATYSSSANFGSGSVGYDSGSIAPHPPLSPYSSSDFVPVGIGGDSFTSTTLTYDFSSTGQFNTWCVDIYHWLVGGNVTYTVETGSDLATALTALRPASSGQPDGTTRVLRLGQLANEVYSSVDTRDESAAFQLAVWAITYGTTEAGYFHINTTDPGFRVNTSTATSAPGLLANTWLANLGTASSNTVNYRLTYLSDATTTTPENTQDMVVFTRIAEPATLALLGLGLAGFGFSRRKRAS